MIITEASRSPEISSISVTKSTHEPSFEYMLPIYPPSKSLLIEITHSCIQRTYILKPSRAELIKRIRGKYAYIATSSEEFALNKQREIEQELA